VEVGICKYLEYDLIHGHAHQVRKETKEQMGKDAEELLGVI